MLILFVGLILLAAPFLIVGLFSDKKTGFIYVLFFLLLFQTILGLLTQFLGIFYYWVIVACTLVADLSLLVFFRKKIVLNFKNIDWIVLFVVVVSILSLYQVHYNYTGKISLATDQTVSYHDVKNNSYTYPYFSDEWYAVSLIKGSINSHSLPLLNTLNNKFFLNLELFFHSLIAEIMLILGLDPLLQYTFLSIFFNTLIILLIYLFLRLNNISKLASAISSLLALYITCGANLPGLWHLIPLNSGILFFLLGLCFMQIKDIKTTIVSFILASLFYPPLIPFYFIGLLVFLFPKIKISKKQLLLIFIIPVTYVLLMVSPLAKTTSYILSRIFFISLVAPSIPQFHFYNVIPIPAIFLAILGLYFIYKNKKWVLLSELVLCFVFWFFYSFGTGRFFAEYERVVIFASIIVVIISGFGFKQLEQKYTKNFKIIEILVLIGFLILIPIYTKGENWKKLVSVYPVNGAVFYPKSPANNYLTQSDLRIFKDIKSKKFLSIPWKGTVIGVATDNYPVLTKEGTISIGSANILNDFLKGNCVDKTKLVKKYRLDYIYVYKFNCPEFEKIDESQEGFVLYKLKSK